jgi:integrase
VFTFGGAAPVNGWAKVKARLDAASKVSNWVIHDLRRTTATGLQKLGTPLQVTEAILGHVAGSRGGIVGIYQRHDSAKEKQAALEAWGAHVMGLMV